MKIITRISVLIAIFAFSLMLAGCQEKGPAEKAGEKIDEAVEETKEEASKAKKKIEESVD